MQRKQRDEVDKAERLRVLEAENARLRRLLSEKERELQVLDETFRTTPDYLRPGEFHQAVIRREPSLAQQVANFLTEQIYSGVFAPGEMLPSEAQLAKQLNVSPTVIREALAPMKHEGLLESRKGGRSRVARDFSGLVFRLDVDDRQDPNFLAHLYELRAIIEPEAAALAAVRATEEALAIIRERYEALKRALEEGREGTDESHAFHKAILDASGNPHLAKFLSWVGKKIWSFIQNNDLDYRSEMISTAQREHEAIIEAIMNRDHVKARELARRHVLNAARRHGLDIQLP